MVNFGPLTAEICWRGGFGAPQQILTGFASWLRYCTDVAQRRSTKLCTMFGCLLGSYIMYTFWGLLPPNGILPVQAHCKPGRNFTTKSDGDMRIEEGTRRARRLQFEVHRAERGGVIGERQQGLGKGSAPPPSPLNTTYRNLGERRNLPQWSPECKLILCTVRPGNGH